LIKKLDILIIRSFIGPFIVTFFVSLFVLIMQFFWLYMDEMIGKGISVWMLIQLLVYMSTTLVPLALPLSVLLSSIMTFGNMGENFELVAIKSSGISLLRFMLPLFVFITFLAFLAFLFSNNVIPVANLKALSLLYDVRNSKPTLNIRPDQFNNEIQGYSIRVGSKDKDGNTIRDVIIYDHTDMSGNNKIILAKKGQMIAAPDKLSLIFKLTDGWRYEEGYEHGAHNFTQTRMHFAKWDKIFDLTAFKFTRSNEDLFKNAYQMQNVSQLSDNIDSFKRSTIKIAGTVGGYLVPYITFNNATKEADKINKTARGSVGIAQTYDTSFLQLIPDTLRASVLQTTLSNLRNFKSGRR
jgi:lipopolysaccharide export system permease protein